jgi:MFS family permease
MTSSPSTIGERTAAHNAMARRATIASTVGSALEWIDFTAYGALSATVFPKLFFPSLTPGTALLAAFATFGVGFFARPLGGLFFGMLGDKLGRKKVLLYTLVLMGLASFLIGCLPAYSVIGVAAPALLVTLRFLQGFALGGEATGAQLMTMEHAPPNRRGLYGSFINLGSSVSAAVANGLIFGLIALLGSEAFESWGWRLPFLMSVVLVFLGLYIRLRVSETPAFAQAKRDETVKRIPVLEAFREYPRPILRLLLIWCAPASCFYVINVFTLSYVTNTLGMANGTAYLCLMGANLVALLTVVGGGALSDKIGRKPTMLISAIMMMIAALCYFPLLDTRSWPLIFLAMASFVGSLQIQSGVQPAFFAEPFPTRVRYSGSAAAYTGANLVAGGPTPFVAAWLLQQSGGATWVITTMCVAVIAIAIIGILASPETRHNDLSR